ncbi:hypothetical protein AXF42_Ash006761 [Apostasia shenzhenica]|uniref:Cleavage/polyadenylation specificity factor A subunit N-terminal domain-containing protein n=1 Tax=Apostasia shenzhenica TaxID=1088818 RepID=A0A2I0AJ28_9ASPA|nr:hypothetical protein AXF42_Ash006761 [Apostasia shenzhenica]
MRVQASKLDLLSKTTPPLPSSSPSISSLIFEPFSSSLALRLSDSSYLLLPSFFPLSSSPPSLPPTSVPPISAASFLRLLPAGRVLFLAAAPIAAGAALALRAWILLAEPPRFAAARLTYKKSSPASLPLAHGFGVQLAGAVNYFVVHAPAAGQIWIMAARIEDGEKLCIELVKCAVVECELPIYSISVSPGVMVLGEMGGVRVFPLRPLVKGNEVKAKGNGPGVTSGNSVDRLMELRKSVVPNGVVASASSLGRGGKAELPKDGKAGGQNDQCKLRCARLHQKSGDFCSFPMELNSDNATPESCTGARPSVKAISVQVLSQKQFLVLDTSGDLHLLTQSGRFTASETKANSSGSSKFTNLNYLDLDMKLQAFAVISGSEFVWITDGAYSVHVMSMIDIISPDKDDNDKDVKEMKTILSAAQVIFTSEKVQHMVALSANAVLVLGQTSVFAYSIL